MEEKESKLPEEINEAQGVVQGKPELEVSSEPTESKVSEQVPSPEVVSEEVSEKIVLEGSNQPVEQEQSVAPEKVDEKAIEEVAEDTQEEKTEEPHEDEKLLESLVLDDATKSDLLGALRSVSNMTQMRLLDKALKEINPLYDKTYETEKEVARAKFLEEGNKSEDFEYRGDEVDTAYLELYEKLRHKKQKFFFELEKSKDDNFKRKEEILEQLRELVDGEESTTSMNAVKDLQQEWKSIGHVPAGQVKTLWASYNALMDRFYDNRSIYFELKELDRRKNLTAKTELCEKAEALVNAEHLKDAIVQLNELHEEYKHIGPVPKAEQEELWQRFKAASDKVYEKRKEHYDILKTELSANAEKKQALCDEVDKLVGFTSDKISDWNKKTKELLALQKQWEAIGGVPREKSKVINKVFWGGFKKFFAHKNEFFKSLEGQREENLKLKEALLAKAEEWKSSEEWDKAANEFKRLQSQWREIGPVPEKVRNEVYKKFKKACDDFFDRKRANGSEQDKEFEQNLVKKEEVCAKLEAYLNSDTIELSEVYELFSDFSAIGFVPRHSIKKIQSKFDAVTKKLIELDDLTEIQKVEVETQLELSKMRGGSRGGDSQGRMEATLRRKIGDLENDIATWNRNLDFFAASKTADKLREEFDKKIENAGQQVIQLKKQLKMLRDS